ncbi:MAG: acyltransferase family protein [Pseudonocardiales bacterium]
MSGRDRLTFIDIGRGLGALFVLYTHVQAVWLREMDPALSAVSGVVFSVVLDPLFLSVDGLGQIAVVIFFLTSGYVVTPIALRLGGSRFGVNRLFRVYPLLIGSVLLAGSCVGLGLTVLSVPEFSGVSPTTLLMNALLLNFVFDPQSTLLGVAWTLLVEIMFYILIILLLPVFRRTAQLAIAIELTVVFVVISLHAVLSGYSAEFVTSMAMLLFPILGQVGWAAQRRLIPISFAGLYLLIGWLLFVWAAGVEASGLDDGYETAGVVAVLMFFVGLFAESRLRPRRVWAFLSDRCYSIYLLHGVVTIAVLNAAFPTVGMPAALGLALIATALVVEIMYRYVERPSHELGRRLSRAHRHQTPKRAISLEPSSARPAREGPAREGAVP